MVCCVSFWCLMFVIEKQLFSPEAVLSWQIILTAWNTDVSTEIHVQKHSANYTLRNDAVKNSTMHFFILLSKVFCIHLWWVAFCIKPHEWAKCIFVFVQGHIILMLSCCCCFTDTTWDNRKCWIRKWAQGSFTDRMALFTLKETQRGHRVCERLPMPDHISATCCPLHASRARD